MHHLRFSVVAVHICFITRVLCHNTRYSDCWTGKYSIKALRELNFVHLSLKFFHFSWPCKWKWKEITSIPRRKIKFCSFPVQFRSSSRRTSAELSAQTKTTWPTPITTLLFSPHFKFVTPAYLYQTYEFHGVIASGAFGTVYRVVDRAERNVFALKVLQKAQVIWLQWNWAGFIADMSEK